MKRRSLFKLFACATAAAAMDALGLMPTTKAEVTYFEPWKYTGEVRWVNAAISDYRALMVAAYQPQIIKCGMTTGRAR